MRYGYERQKANRDRMEINRKKTSFCEILANSYTIRVMQMRYTRHGSV